MKNLQSYTLTILAGLLLLTACEKTIPLDIKDVKKKVVVNSLFFADSIIDVKLSASAQIAAGQHTNPIQNAIVQLYKNGELVEELQEISMGQYKSTHRAEIESAYTLDVNTSLGHVSATSTVPQPVQVIKLDTVQIANLVFESWIGLERVYNMKLTFVDPPEANFYILRVTARDSATDDPYVYIPGGIFYYETDYNAHGNEIDTELLVNTYIYLKLPDEEFNGTEKTYSFGFKPYNYGPGLLFSLEIYSLDAHFYHFINTLDIYDWVMYDFFSEPINVHSNVEGGLGIFAGATAVKIPMIIKYDSIYY